MTKLLVWESPQVLFLSISQLILKAPPDPFRPHAMGSMVSFMIWFFPTWYTVKGKEDSGADDLTSWYNAPDLTLFLVMPPLMTSNGSGVWCWLKLTYPWSCFTWTTVGTRKCAFSKSELTWRESTIKPNKGPATVRVTWLENDNNEIR